MKTKIFFIAFFSVIALKAQSSLTIGANASLNVGTGADICADALSGTINGSGTFCGIPTEVETETEKTVPTEYALEQNYPNPFNPSTTIKYSIPNFSLSQSSRAESREVGFVTLTVYDVIGNEIATLVNEEKPAGVYEVEFNSSNLSSGVYFYKLTAGSFVETKKMTVLK